MEKYDNDEREVEEVVAEDEAMGYHRNPLRPSRVKRALQKAMLCAAAICVITIAVIAVKHYLRPNPYKPFIETYDYKAFDTDISYELRNGDRYISHDQIEKLQALFIKVDKGENLKSTINDLLHIMYIAETTNSTLYNPTAWNLAIAHLKEGDGVTARIVLEEMLKRNQVHNPEAAMHIRDLLYRLDEIDAQ